jgi:glucan phosphoethanolaminetransferase (alkaline phosphatase superfamily)
VTTEVEPRPNWGRRALWAGGLLAVFVVAVIAASATVPRWWAHRIGAQVDGSITQGTLLGLVYGFVFTFLPIIVLILILRWRRTWKTVIVAVVLAVVLALPNLMTLSIVVGRGSAAHAGDRVLDVEGPAFRGGTLAGAILAGLLVAFIAYLMVSRDRAHSSARRARESSTEAAAAPPVEPGS